MCLLSDKKNYTTITQNCKGKHGQYCRIAKLLLGYNTCMDKNTLLSPDELLSDIRHRVSVCGGHAAAARSILDGGSAAHLADVLHQRRPISDRMARKFGYARRVVYERIQPKTMPAAPVEAPDYDILTYTD